MRKSASLEVCMYSRCCALLGACISIIAVGESFAKTTSSEIELAAHLDWTGHVNQTLTRDGSVLNEFIAQTISVNVDDAVLSLSMIPRFACVPIASIHVKDPALVAQAREVGFVVDNQVVDYPFIPDTEGENGRFTLSSVEKDQKKLRVILDIATKAVFTWAVVSDVPQLSNESSNDKNSLGAASEAVDQFDFSLLGSQRTLEAMEDMCRMHTPIPLNQ